MAQTTEAVGAAPDSGKAGSARPSETVRATVETPNGPPPPKSGRGLFQKIWPAGLAFVVYLLVALFAYRHTGLSSGLPGCACGDQAQEVSFIAWPTYALEHARNPFYTSWVNYPVGVNLAVNTTALLLGILAIPVVLAFGPVVAFNLLLVLGFALSALAMCLVLRRWVRWWPAAFVGGLLYGFSPYMIGQGWGHLFLVFVPIPPLILLALDEIVVRQSSSSLRYGLLLGLLAAAQYYISDEVLALTGIVAVIGVLLLAVTHWREALRRARHVIEAFAYAAVACGILVAYPVWYTYFGPAHINGPPQSLASLATFPGDLVAGIAPTVSQLFGSAHLKSIGDHLTGGDVTENGMYLGIPLIVALGLIVGFCRRVRTVVFFAVMLLVSYVLALGSRLHIDKHNTGIPMPYAILIHLPVIQNLLPVRFSLFVQLFAVLILAIGLDRCYHWLRANWASRHANAHARGRHRPWLAVTLTAAFAAAALFPLVPKIPYSAASTDIPTLFDSPAIDNIPVGSVVLVYPYPFDPRDQILLPQALSDMRFKIIGGPGHVPHPRGFPTYGPSILSPLAIEVLFNAAYSDLKLSATQYPPTTAGNLADLKTFLLHYQVGTIVVYPFGHAPAGVARYVSALLGPPQWRQGVDAWFGVQKTLSR